MQTLKFLGRGSAFNIQERNTSAYIKKDGNLLLLDCGENIFQKIIETKLLDNVKEVNVAITHCHSDHVGSLSSLILYCYFIKHIKTNVYLANSNLVGLLDSMGVTNEYCELYNCIFNPSLLIKNMNIEIGFIPTDHCKEIYSYGIIFAKEKDKVIYYSGDCNNIDEGIINALKEGNIIEFYQDTCLADYDGNVHLSLRKLCELIPKEYRHKVYCMHIDCPELIEKAKTEGFNVVEVEEVK